MDMLFQFQIMADSGLLILICLVQWIIYPSFDYLETENFKAWHSRYMRIISFIVVPLILLQVGVELSHALAAEPRWWRTFLIGVVLIATFSLSVPCHKKLQSMGKSAVIIRKLVLTNWIRTLLWTILFLQTLWQGINGQGYLH
jgi:hypothetical protein